MAKREWWFCKVCENQNPPSAGICEQCGSPADIEKSEIESRQEGYKKQGPLKPTQIDGPETTLPERRPDGSNIIPTNELIQSFFFTILGGWLAWRFLKDEQAVFAFSKRASTYIEVSGFFSSLLGALAMLMVASSSLSIIADHFDRRPNEPAYKKFNKVCSIAFVILTLLAIFVGWKLEHIRVLHR